MYPGANLRIQKTVSTPILESRMNEITKAITWFEEFTEGHLIRPTPKQIDEQIEKRKGGFLVYRVDSEPIQSEFIFKDDLFSIVVAIHDYYCLDEIEVKGQPEYRLLEYCRSMDSSYEAIEVVVPSLKYPG